MPPPLHEPPKIPPRAPFAAHALSVLFYFWFLFQCAILSLVGKAAMQGSHSPGATRADWARSNVTFFTVSLLLMLLCGTAALFLRRKTSAAFPKLLVFLLAIGLFMLIAMPFGWFSI